VIKEEGSAETVLPSALLSGSLDGVHGAAVNASAAIGASIGVDDANIALLGDSAQRTGVVAGTTVDAFFSDGIGQGIHLLFVKIGSMASMPLPFLYNSSRFLVHPKAMPGRGPA
jgi:hypothetical protein